MLITGTEWDGVRRDLRLEAGFIVEIAPGLDRRPGERRVDAKGCALLPGLHDHHIHLRATAAAMSSIPCGPPEVGDEAELARRLRDAAQQLPEGSWLRGVGYHESVAGRLDATRIDAWTPDRPVRIQHRSGALWTLNTRAMRAIAPSEGEWPNGVELDDAGNPNGRFDRLDAWLRTRWPGAAGQDIAPLSRALAQLGVTGLTDATAGQDDADAAFLAAEIDHGQLLQRCWMMGGAKLGHIEHPRLARGPLKILLDERALPDYSDVVGRVRAAHAENRAVAFHCVTRTELVLAVTATLEAGPREGDRIEHASVAPPELVGLVARSRMRVVTQPRFLYERGDDYLGDVEPEDRPWLYRTRGWMDAGVPVAAGSDAPYAHFDPWQAMRSAVERQTKSGAVIGGDEVLTPEEALGLFSANPARPGDASPELGVGSAADLILLDRPWSEARSLRSSNPVRMTWVGGQIVWDRDA